MSFQQQRAFPVLLGSGVRRISLAILAFALLIAVMHLRTYLMTRKIQAVLRGLNEIRLDQTSEDEINRVVPHLDSRDVQWHGESRRVYYAHISDEDDHWARFFFSHKFKAVAGWFGYRYLSFDAAAVVVQGKVVDVSYGLANQWIRPQYAGYAGYIVSARSVHGFWLERQYPFHVSSQADFSPRYRPSRFGSDLSVIYTADAPSSTTDRIFKLDLSCFWSPRGCNDSRQIAPIMWNDVDSIKRRTYDQLNSGKCPDSIVEGRLKYLPDLSVLLLEVTGSRRIEVNEEGARTEDWFTDYRVEEVLRGRSYSPSLKNVRFQRLISSVLDPTRMMANQIYPETKIGSQVLYFWNPGFASCRFIPATPSAVQLIRTTPPPVRKWEDEIPMGLQ